MTDPCNYGIYANMTGVFVDGIHGTPYIAAPLGSVMGIYIYIIPLLFQLLSIDIPISYGKEEIVRYTHLSIDISIDIPSVIP